MVLEMFYKNTYFWEIVPPPKQIHNSTHKKIHEHALHIVYVFKTKCMYV